MLPALGLEQLNERDRFGRAPLHILANNRKEGTLKAAMIAQLCEARADVNIKGNRGVTPLHKAVATSAELQIRALVHCGADLGERNDSGTTPWDASWNNRRIRELLNQVQAAPGAGVTGEGRF